MLIPIREIGESIKIGDDVTITVEDINKMHVGIGIDAPKEVPVWREEIYYKIQRAAESPKVPLSDHPG